MASFFDKLIQAFQLDNGTPKQPQLAAKAQPLPSLISADSLRPVSHPHPEDLDINTPVKDQLNAEEWDARTDITYHSNELVFRRRLRKALEQKEMYLSKTLNLQMLARLLHSNRTYLLRHLNSLYGDSYTVIINQFRIAYALQLMQSKEYDEDRQTKLYSRCGYKNSVTFYRNFYRYTGLTTSEWLEQCRHMKVLEMAAKITEVPEETK